MKPTSSKFKRSISMTNFPVIAIFFNLVFFSCGENKSSYADGDTMPPLEVQCGKEERQNVPKNINGNTRWDIVVNTSGEQACATTFSYLPYAQDEVTGWKPGNLGDTYENVSAVRCTCGVLNEMKDSKCKFVMTLVRAK
jgi:hypothetical protein